jgi:hypothetical protein
MVERAVGCNFKKEQSKDHSKQNWIHLANDFRGRIECAKLSTKTDATCGYVSYTEKKLDLYWNTNVTFG